MPIIRLLGFEDFEQWPSMRYSMPTTSKRLSEFYEIPFDVICKHEFIATNAYQERYGIRTLDIAKRLIDFGYHPPTIYFPLIVPEAMMFEPTETESKERLDDIASAMKIIAEECRRDPEKVKRRRPFHGGWSGR